MSYDLPGYHFNPIKTGQIFKQLRQAKGLSGSAAARLSGLTYDTIDNIERGRVQDIKFEAYFKLCVVYETSMEAVALLMLTGDEIDFRDRIMLYLPKEDNVMPADVLDAVPSFVPDTVVAAAEAVAATDAPVQPVRKSAEDTDNVAQLHKHIAKLMDLLEKAIERG